MIAGCSSGVEPAFGLAFEKHVTVGKFKYTNEIFRTVLEDRLLYADEDSLSKPTCWNRDLFDSLYGEIVANHGSCQGLWQVPKNIQRVFVTAMDIHWADHIYAEAVWQKWISNAIAKTINMPGSATVDDVKRAYLIAHELGLKGITVYRDGSRAAQVLHVSGDKTYQTAQPSAAVKKALSNLRDNEYIASEIRAVVEDIWAPRVEKLADGLSIIHYTGSEPTADFSTALTTELWFRQQRTTTSGVYPCPTCNMPLIIQDGCKSCKSCGWSACSS
jgi:ribonucleoside-diphosphate reductase alpha chain